MENPNQSVLSAICEAFPLLSRLLTKRGQFAGVLWVRTLRTLKGVTAVVTKETRATVRAGLDYDARAKVQDARESGDLPAENNGLPWGEWEAFPYIIRHTRKGESTVRRYVRLYPVEGHSPKVIYRIDGNMASEAQARALCLASEFSKVDAAIGCFTLGLESIRRVR